MPEKTKNINANYAWYVVLVLLIVAITSFLDRYLISLLIEPIKVSMRISDTQISFLQGAAFALFYVIFGLPLGALVDRWNLRNILVLGIIIWSSLTVASGFASSYTELFLARAGLGIGEACLAPAAFSLIADYFLPAKRGRPMGIYNMANYLGAGASLLVGGAVLRALGGAAASTWLPMLGHVANWRVVFLIVGAPGLPLALLMFSIREPNRTSPVGSAATVRPGFSVFWNHLRTTPGAYAAVYFVSTMTAFVGLTLAAWMPSFFIRSFAMKPAAVGLLLGPIMVGSGVLGCLTSGILSDRLVATGRSGGRFLVSVLWWPMAFVGLLLLASAHNKNMALVAFTIINFGSGLGLASVPPTLYDMTPNRLRGRATALFFIFSGVLGMGMAPTLVAFVTDHVFHNPMAIRGSLLVVLLPVIVVSFLVCLAGLRTYEKARLGFREVFSQSQAKTS